MAAANCRWCFAQALVLRRDPIFPRLVTQRDKIATSL